MRDYFDELNDNVNLLSDVANDMISYFQMKAWHKLKLKSIENVKEFAWS